MTTGASVPRVAIVSSVHKWTDNRIHYREAASLHGAGFDVTLVAVEHDIDSPTTGVKVVRLPQRRSRVHRLLLGGLTAIRVALRNRPTIIHLHDPELVWAIPVLRVLGRRVVYDAHEDLPRQLANRDYRSPARRRLLRMIGRGVLAIARSADHVIAATESIARSFPQDRTTVVRNFPRTEIKELGTQRRDAVAYVGLLTERRGATSMVEAFGHQDFPNAWTADVAGPVDPPSLLGQLQSRPGWKRVQFHGQISPPAVESLLESAQVGVVVLQRSQAYLESLPTKMFEYFAAGLPVIASDFPLWREIIERHECGLLVDETNPAEIARAVHRYANDAELRARHSENALRAARTELNWASEEARLLSAYGRLLDG